jgi:hypothetical protein
MVSLILLVALLVAGTVGYGLRHFLIIVDTSAASRMIKADQPALQRGTIESIGYPLSRLIPKYFSRIGRDLYWAAFADPSWAEKTPAWIVGRQVLMGIALGVTTGWLLQSNLGLWIGGMVGWTLMRADLAARSERVRKRISQELPEFLQLMAAESASGAGLETVLMRAAQGEGYLPAWLRRVLSIARGRGLLPSRETGEGILRQEAEKSGHSDLIGFAMQMGFALQGTQVRDTLTRLAAQFSDAYVGQAEIRTEKLANTLGILVAVFYFLPFLLVILFVVGVPLIKAF